MAGQPPCEAVSWNEFDGDQKGIRRGQPPCEAVSWNVAVSFHFSRIWCQPPCEAVSWNDYKYRQGEVLAVSLLVRLWVEISRNTTEETKRSGQPPCEAVSWNIALSVSKQDQISQPPCEAVSWNPMSASSFFPGFRQPPCEAVSWNFGVLWHFQSLNHVSLLVRLWVEIDFCTLLHRIRFRQPPCEAVSWNTFIWDMDARNTRQPPCEAVSWNEKSIPHVQIHPVSLLVRLWVEIWSPRYPELLASSSASLWGCELKYIRRICSNVRSESASLWGCELKYYNDNGTMKLAASASLWGCELKSENEENV